MMLFVHFAVAFFVALILSLIFVRGFRRGGPWASFLAFFIIVFATIGYILVGCIRAALPSVGVDFRPGDCRSLGTLQADPTLGGTGAKG